MKMSYETIFELGRCNYNDANDGSWIPTPNFILPNSPEFFIWNAGIEFEIKRWWMKGCVKRILWEGCT